MRLAVPAILGVLCFGFLNANCVFAQTSRAIVVDGAGPWRDDRWIFTAGQCTSLLRDAGYTVTTVSPLDLPSAIAPGNVLLAVPSLESLPVDTLTAIGRFAASGGSLMASGGEPFRSPLYRTPNGEWLEAAAYQAATGSPASPVPWIAPFVPTISPASQQYTSSSGKRIPVINRRGLFGSFGGRIRVIGEVLEPAATIYSDLVAAFAMRFLIIWLPWPDLPVSHRAELVAALRAGTTGAHLQSAGPPVPVSLVGEAITGQAIVINMSNAPVRATLQWSIGGGAVPLPQAPVPVPMAAGGDARVPLQFPTLPRGEYTLMFRLMVGDQEVDRIDSPFRVFDPLVSNHPDQKITVVDGAFLANGKRVFLHGVNYWPRYATGFGVNTSWLVPELYDPVQIEADLALMASLHFNLVNIRYVGANEVWAPQARSLIDFLERCRNHSIWVRIEMPAFLGNNAFRGSLNPQLGAFLTAAFLPGNDRVFAYEFLWEPYLGMQKEGGYGGYLNGEPIRQGAGRSALDGEWRTWVDEQYGSLANARQIWGIELPLNETGQLTNPTDEQLAGDGPWRIMVAAYRRFADDYFGRGLGAAAREIRRTDPVTLMTYRNWSAMTAFGNVNMGYDLGTGSAHLDFLSPENYDTILWPERRKWGFATAYSRHRSGGKPVHWVEFGYNIGGNGDIAGRAAQTALCDASMRLIEEDGSNADTIWWWPGGSSVIDGADFGIIDLDGTPRGCAVALAQWGAKFKQTPPGMTAASTTTFTIDREEDARGQHGLFLKWADQYAAARVAGQTVQLVGAGTGTDTSTMPVMQIGNAGYNGVGPLKFANAEVGGLRVMCPGIDVTVENGAQVRVPAGAACRVITTLVNTGEARWLPAAASRGGVALRTSVGDVPLSAELPPLRSIELAPLDVNTDQRTVLLTGRMSAGGVGDFGELLRLTLAVDPGGPESCSASLNLTGNISVPAAGGSATVNIATGMGCAWSAQSLQPWVAFRPTAGTGSGALTYTIPANVGPPRRTTIEIAGNALTVLQAGVDSTLVSPPAFSAASLRFGSQTLGTASAAQTVTVTNTSQSPLNLALVEIGGRNSADFSQSNTCGIALAAAASCTIEVRFAPARSGPRTASLFVRGNAVGGTFAIDLSGPGVAAGTSPAIQAIADVWNYTSGVAPGTWVSVVGTNLSPFAQIANLGAREQLPTSLGGTTVTFNGILAALAYASPSQINALVPASVTPGPVTVVVETSGGAGSPFMVTASATRPAIYAVPNRTATAYSVTAALQGTGFLVGDATVDSRVNRAVFPGDVVDLYMIGLGATKDPSAFVTDRQFAGAFPVSSPVAAKVGGQTAPVLFAGLTGPGLYLVRIGIPLDLKPGTQPIEVSTGDASAEGARTSSLLSLTIASPTVNLMRNGGFESSLAGSWDFHASGGAAVETTAATRTAGRSAAAIIVSPSAVADAEGKSARLSQNDLMLQPGQIYRLSFWAKSDAGRSVHIAVATGEPVVETEILTTENWRRYVVYFQTAAPAGAARIDFDFGGRPGAVWLDDIVLQGSTP